MNLTPIGNSGGFFLSFVSEARRLLIVYRGNRGIGGGRGMDKINVDTYETMYYYVSANNGMTRGELR